MNHQLVNRKRVRSYGWLLLLLLITGCEPWDLLHLPSGLIAYYPFDGNNLDVSGNNLNGQAINGASKYGPDRHGVSGSALLLDGVDDYVEVADDNKLRPTDGLSISLWINADSIGSTSHLYNKANYVGNTNQQYSAFIRPHTPLTKDCCEIIVDVNQDGVCTAKSLKEYINYYDPTYQLKRWYHIVTVFGNQSLKLYVDGELKQPVVPQPTNAIDPCVGGNLRFGAQRSGDENNFDGMMDDIRVYNRALTGYEVKALYKL